MQPSLNKPHQTELINNKEKTHIEWVSAFLLKKQVFFFSQSKFATNFTYC